MSRQAVNNQSPRGASRSRARLMSETRVPLIQNAVLEEFARNGSTVGAGRRWDFGRRKKWNKTFSMPWKNCFILIF